MKNINKCGIAGLVVMILMNFTSCKNSFLEITPKSKLIAKTVADYDLLFNNLNLINTSGTSVTSLNTTPNYPNGQIPMGDEVISIDPYYSAAALRTERLFRWDDVIYDPEQDSGEMTAIMTQLYTYNKIANEVMSATNGTDAQRSALYGEALANRAWCYFMLINYFGKPYNASTAANDPGFPIITAADVAATGFTRASVQQVYDFMINDLKTAIPLLPQNVAINARLCKSAAEALLGKTYVFMGQYQNGLTYLNAAMSDLPTTITVALYNLNITMATGGTWGYVYTPTSYQTLYPTAWVNTENLFAKQANAGAWNSANSDILLSPDAAALFKPSDVRLKFYSPQATGGGGYAVTGALRRATGTQVQIGVRIADLILLKAECEARLNDLTSAKNDLEGFRKTRMPAADATVNITDPTTMVKFIIDERTREFAVQGFRWFDMRRLSVDPIFAGTIYTHKLYSSTGALVNTFTLKADRLTLRFAQKVIDQNPGMSNNP